MGALEVFLSVPWILKELISSLTSSLKYHHLDRSVWSPNDSDFQLTSKFILCEQKQELFLTMEKINC